MGDVWVLAEFTGDPAPPDPARSGTAQRTGGDSRLETREAPSPETREACVVADWLARRLGGEVHVWVFGDRVGEDDGLRPGLFQGLAAEVLTAEDESPAGFEPRVRATTMAAEFRARLRAGNPPEIVVFPALHRAAAVASTLAAALNTGLVSHCLEFRVDVGRLEMLVPAFGGLAAITCPKARPVLVTLGGGVARRMGLSEALRDHDPPPRLSRVGVPKAARAAAAGAPRPVRAERAPATAPDSGPSLAAARVVVGGGAGVARPETWVLVERLAGYLGGAVGATRPAVDEGVAREAQMIGQSGVRVAPDLYLALGVFGDLQHTVGVEGARTVIAVNRDPAAPIFSRADRGVVADLEEFLPRLIEEIERIKGERG